MVQLKVLHGNARLASIRCSCSILDMSTVQEIENAIEKLTEEQIEELRAWLFDRAISQGATNGSLDLLAQEALNEKRIGRTKQL